MIEEKVDVVHQDASD